MAGLEYPRYIGHESAGIISAKGEKAGKKFNVGDRVSVWVDGKGFAEKLTVTEDRIFPVGDNITFEEAMAEPIGCSANGVIKAGIQLGDVVAVTGSGFMGLIILQLAKLKGPSKIIAIDIRDDILDLAKELGADMIINPRKEDAAKRVFEITEGRGVDVSIEAGGIQQTLDLAASITRMEGKLVIFGYHPGKRTIQDLGFWNWMAFDIINAHFRDLRTILNGTRIGMQLLNEGKLKMDKLITHTYPLEEINDGFAAARDKPGLFIKSVVTVN